MKSILRIIVAPLINQLPLCIFLFLLWGMGLFISLFGPLYTYDLKVFIVNIILQPFLFFSGIFFLMYLFAVITDLINKRWFKKEKISCPKINDDTSYGVTNGEHQITMVTKLNRDRIYKDLFEKLSEIED